jgi:hypothetical protein
MSPHADRGRVKGGWSRQRKGGNMSEKVLEAFMEKETFNIFELMLKLKVDKNPLKEALDALVRMGKLRIVEKRSPHPDDLSLHQGLSSRSSIRGFSGGFYVLNG